MQESKPIMLVVWAISKLKDVELGVVNAEMEMLVVWFQAALSLQFERIHSHDFQRLSNLGH